MNNEATCFKNVDKPFCIDLFLSNNSKFFENCLALETSLPDFHKFVVTVIKTKQERFPPKIVKFIEYKKFDTEVFNTTLKILLLFITFF